MPNSIEVSITTAKNRLGFELEAINKALEAIRSQVEKLGESYPSEDVRLVLLEQGRRRHDNVFDNVDGVRRRLDSYLVVGDKK